MARVDFSNLKHRLLTYGFLLGSASLLTAKWNDPKMAAATLGASAVGGVALEVLKSVSGEVFGADWHSRLSERIGDESAFLQNHDLTEAVGQALSVSIRFASRHAPADSPLRGRQDALRAMAKEALKNWMRVAEEQSADFAPLLESGLPEIFTRPVTEWADAQVLSSEAWEILLPRLAWGGNLPDRFGYVPPEAISALAAELPRLFPRALREVIKHDAANGGKAYPSLLLLMVGEFGATLKEFWKESRVAHAVTHEKLDELLARLPTLTISEIKSNLPSQASPFVAAGREGDLQKVIEALESSGRAAITGIGGMGKSRLAGEVARRQLEKYPDGCVWVRASASLEEGFRTAAIDLGWSEAEQQDAAIFRAQVRRRLSGWTHGLLILDNADDVTDLLDWLPENRGCHALLTLRPEGKSGLTEAHLTSLSPDDGATMLLSRMGKLSPSDQEREEARLLSEDLGGLPLALTQAAAYIASMGESLAGYRTLFSEESERGVLLQYEGQSLHKDHDPVYRTFALAFRRLTEPPKTPETERQTTARLAAADLLKMMAFLAPNAIPEGLFLNKDAEVLGESLALAVASRTLWNETIAAARHLALLDFDREKRSSQSIG